MPKASAKHLLEKGWVFLVTIFNYSCCLICLIHVFLPSYSRIDYNFVNFSTLMSLVRRQEERLASKISSKHSLFTDLT